MALTYTANVNLIWNDGEGIEAGDLTASANALAPMTFSDFFLFPQFNLSPSNSRYSSNDATAYNQVWTEGASTCAKVSNDGYGVSNLTGTIYMFLGNAQYPNASNTVPTALYSLNLQEECLLLNASNFPADATNPRYATIGLTVALGTTNQTRDFEDNTTRVITSTAVPKYRTLVVTQNITLGTAGPSPTVPAFTGLPWAIVYIPANFSAHYVDGVNIFPMSIPRQLRRWALPVLNGFQQTGSFTLNTTSLDVTSPGTSTPQFVMQIPVGSQTVQLLRIYVNCSVLTNCFSIIYNNGTNHTLVGSSYMNSILTTGADGLTYYDFTKLPPLSGYALYCAATEGSIGGIYSPFEAFTNHRLPIYLLWSPTAGSQVLRSVEVVTAGT
jgi:hypothetical protein